MSEKKEDKGVRKAHVVMDLSSRALKAKKIEILLGLGEIKREKPLQVLEIGCGSGGISHYFATADHLSCHVTAVDVCDNRQVLDGYDFLLVDGVDLPFEDAKFDVVITNHVIEHVGEKKEQIRHLEEIKRVMAPNGVGYLAVPNRWMLNEPHYRLWFLSWWPRSWRNAYLRLMGKGAFYDCEPLEMGELEGMLKQVGLRYENECTEGLRQTLLLERPISIFTKIIFRTPYLFFRPFLFLIPTLIYRIAKYN